MTEPLKKFLKKETKQGLCSQETHSPPDSQGGADHKTATTEEMQKSTLFLRNSKQFPYLAFQVNDLNLLPLQM